MNSIVVLMQIFKQVQIIFFPELNMLKILFPHFFLLNYAKGDFWDVTPGPVLASPPPVLRSSSSSGPPPPWKMGSRPATSLPYHPQASPPRHRQLLGPSLPHPLNSLLAPGRPPPPGPCPAPSSALGTQCLPASPASSGYRLGLSPLGLLRLARPPPPPATGSGTLAPSALGMCFRPDWNFQFWNGE